MDKYINYIRHMLNNRKNINRIVSLVTAFSVIWMFLMPYAEDLGIVRAYEIKVSLSDELTDPLKKGEELGNNQAIQSVESSWTQLTSQYIDGISVTIGQDAQGNDIVTTGNPINLDGGSESSKYIKLNINYLYTRDELTNTNILTNNYLYYQLPSDLRMAHEYFGENCRLMDKAWNTTKPSGYYSISSTGLLVMRYTNDYINYLKTQTGSFTGTISFNAYVDRADTASGDNTVKFITNSGEWNVEVAFDDDQITMTKTGEVKDSGNGGKYIEWTININNPGGRTNLSSYVLSDLLNDASCSMSDATIDPPNAASISGDVINLTNSGEANITIKYNQNSPQTGTDYTNKAILKDGSNNLVAEAQDTRKIEAGYNISKSGTPDYNIDGTKEGKIRWEIIVESKSGESLAGTSVTDTFAFPADTAVYDYSTGNTINAFSTNGNTLTFGSGVPSKMKIVYYTQADISSLNTNGRVTVTNNATIDPPSGANIPSSSTGDRPVTYEKGVYAEKSADTINIEDNTIKWRVRVYSNKTQYGQDNNSKASVNGYTVQDSMLTNIDVNSITFNAQDTNYQNRSSNVSLTKNGDTITINAASTANGTNIVVNFVELYYTSTLTPEQISTLNSEGSLSVTNNATVTAGGGITAGSSATADIRLRHTISKTYNSSDRSGSEIGTVADEPTSRTLPWKVYLTSDNGFASKTYTDTLESDNNAVAHYFTSDQQSGFVLEYKQKDSDTNWTVIPSGKYSITFTDTNSDGKDDKFVITFDSSIDTSYHNISVSYNSTADTKNTPNGQSVHLDNKAKFDDDNEVPCSGYYFTREDPNVVKTMSLSLRKNWNDSQNIFNGRPSGITLKLYRALCDENGNIPDTDSGSWELCGTFTRNVSSSNGYDDIQLANYPQWTVEENQVKRYCYKIVEDPVPASYDEAYSVQTVKADSDSKNFVMTNTSTQDYGKRAIDTAGKTLTSINYEDIPKLTLTIDGNETECYIFGWDILLNKSAANSMTYIDTLPDKAIFIDNNLTQDVQYKIHTLYTDNWYADANDFYNNNRGTITQNGRTLTFALNRVDDNHVISYIRYYTAIPVDDLADALEDGKLINKVRKEGSADVAAELSVVEPEKPIIEKKFIQGYANGYINYSLTVNPEGKMLSNDGMVDITDKLNFSPNSDKFGDTLDIELDHIEVLPIVDGVTSSTPLNEGEYSYTVVYDEAETRTLNVNNTIHQVSNRYEGYNARYWVIEGYEIGETLEITLNKTDVTNYSSPQLWAFKVLDHDSPQLYNDVVDKSTTFPAFENGQSTLSYTVKPDTNVLIVFDKSYGQNNNPGENDYAVESIDSVTAKAVTPAKLELSVPDQQPLEINYVYRVTGWTSSDKTKFDNTASIDEANASGSASQTESEMMVTDSSGSTSTLTYTKLYKVDVGNYALNTLDATFKIAKYVQGTGWVYASNIRTTHENNSTVEFIELTFPDSPYTDYLESDNKYPSAAADLELSQSENVHNIQLESGTLYKLVETVAPDGYHTPPADRTLTPEFEFYYNYHNYSGTIPEEAAGKVKNILNNGSINIPDIKDISISAEKIFSGDNIPSGSTVVLKLYRSKSKSGTNAEEVSGSEKTLSYVDGGTNNKVQWTGLPSGYNGSPWYYFVREVSYTGTTGNTYTCAADGSNSGRFKPVYTGNGTNTNDTCIEVNNSQGLTIKKIWQNKDGIAITPPNEPNTSTPMSVAFDIYGEKNGERIKLSISETLNSSNDYSYKLPDPVNDTSGNSYSISEFSNFYVEEKLTSSQSESLAGTYLEPQINKKISNGTGVIEILNIADVSGYMNVFVEKVWEMNGSSVTHPDNVTVRLIQSSVSGLTVSELQSASSTINWGEGNSGQAAQTLDSGNNWSYTWSGLPKADTNNNPYYYYVIETTSLNRYTVSYNTSKTSNSSQNTVITNTFKTIDLKIQKSWDDNGEIVDHSGDTVQFVIKRSTDPNAVGTECVSTVVISVSTTTTTTTTTTAETTTTTTTTTTAQNDDFTLSGPDSVLVGQVITITPMSNGSQDTTGNISYYVSGDATLSITQSDNSIIVLGVSQGDYNGSHKATITATRGSCTQTKEITVNTPNKDINQTINSGESVEVILHGNPNETLHYTLGLQNSGWVPQATHNYQTITLDSDGNATVSFNVSDTIANQAHVQLWYADKELEIQSANVRSSGNGNTNTNTVTVNQALNSGGIIQLTADNPNLTISSGQYFVAQITGPANANIQGLLGGNTPSSSWETDNYNSTIGSDGTLTLVIPITHNYSGYIEFQEWNRKSEITLVSYQILNSAPASSSNSALQSYNMNIQNFTPYYSEAPSISDQQTRSKRSSRPLRGGDITKTVGAESKNSEVTELFFNTNVSDIIELGSGKTPDTNINVSIVGGKVKISSRKKDAADNEWTKIISNLPATDENGNTYYYWIEEINVPSGYTASYTNNSVNADEANGTTPEITITNTYIGDSVMLPSSGGKGSKIYSTAGGIIIMLSAAGYLQFKRRRWLSE